MSAFSRVLRIYSNKVSKKERETKFTSSFPKVQTCTTFYLSLFCFILHVRRLPFGWRKRSGKYLFILVFLQFTSIFSNSIPCSLFHSFRCRFKILSESCIPIFLVNFNHVNLKRWTTTKKATHTLTFIIYWYHSQMNSNQRNVFLLCCCFISFDEQQITCEQFSLF